MSAAKHTPGPWFVERIDTDESLTGPVFWIRPAHDSLQSLAEVRAGSDDNDLLFQVEANSRLIAAAPELLERLNEIESMPYSMVNDSESLRHTLKVIQKIARAAIAKAEGREK